MLPLLVQDRFRPSLRFHLISMMSATTRVWRQPALSPATFSHPRQLSHLSSVALAWVTTSPTSVLGKQTFRPLELRICPLALVRTAPKAQWTRHMKLLDQPQPHQSSVLRGLTILQRSLHRLRYCLHPIQPQRGLASMLLQITRRSEGIVKSISEE